MMRDAVSFNHVFGLDEIKIYDQPCYSSMTTTTFTTSTTTTRAGTTTSVLPGTTTPVPTTTTPILPDTATPVPTIPTSVLPDTTTTVTITTTITLPVTTAVVSMTTTSITTTVSTTPSLFESSVITQDVEETLSSNVPIITTTTSTYTTIEPLLQIFSCDFSTTLCFESGELVVTNGNEFTSVDIINEPPRFPLSDVSSIIEPTDNNELCKLPYQPSIDNSTNITSSYVWFCYKNQCPTESQELANCKSGNYGLISVKPWESSKTIVESINEEMMIRSSVGHRCLRYYYYFTVYDKLDWGQQISLMFRFEVTNVNRPDDPASNKTIYFALDNIELDNGNCQSVIDPSTGQTTISQSPTTTITTTSNEVTATSPREQQDVS
ncbi:unnamed protein product [Rotaria sordida]|uniref:Uncharacterized protein n=1 Tax=Rotaria sordida TaxID=392033 RepID=A0A819MSB3_9BILA|nr:unnamed protein product [Rotaria sordida]